MRFTLATLRKKECDAIVVPYTQDSRQSALARHIEDAGVIDRISAGDFGGELGEVYRERTAGAIVLAVGTGKKPFDAATARRWAASASRHIRAAKAKKVAVVVAPSTRIQDTVRAVTEGLLLGDYAFLKYRKGESVEREAAAPEEITLLVPDKKAVKAAQNAVAKGESAARATLFARDLVNEPSSRMTPMDLVRVAKDIAAAHPGSMNLRVMNERELHALGAGGLLAVGRGSDEETHLVHLTYTPKKKAKKRVALVGKGITFDSGGLSLKTSDGMEDMKIDMAGAAAVLAVMSALPALDLPVEVHGITGLAENMPSGKAVKPGDVVETMSGKTIEILNTDAEGRVTLADTLWYGTKLEPDYLIDLATLTGACMVALGQEVAGLFSNDASLSRAINKAATEAGELMWELPLIDEYRPLMKSQVADLKNIGGGRYGGAINAAVFLEEFVGETAWAHIDMAGPAWAERPTFPHQPLGATGFGVRTVLRWLENL